MKTYYADFYANNGTHLCKLITDTNKNRLIKRIRTIENAERFEGNETKWHVWDEAGISVAYGGTRCNGTKYRISECDLRFMY